MVDPALHRAQRDLAFEHERTVGRGRTVCGPEDRCEKQGDKRRAEKHGQAPAGRSSVARRGFKSVVRLRCDQRPGPACGSGLQANANRKGGPFPALLFGPRYETEMHQKTSILQRFGFVAKLVNHALSSFLDEIARRKKSSSIRAEASFAEPAELVAVGRTCQQA